MCGISDGRSIQIVDPFVEQVVSSFNTTTPAVNYTATSSQDGSTVFVLRTTGNLAIYRNQRLLRTIMQHNFRDLSISESGKAFVGISPPLDCSVRFMCVSGIHFDRKSPISIKLWSLHEKKATSTLKYKSNYAPLYIHMTSDGSLVAAHCYSEIRVWRSCDGQILHDIDCPDFLVNNFAGDFVLLSPECMPEPHWGMYRLSTGLVHRLFKFKNALAYQSPEPAIRLSAQMATGLL